MFSLAETCFKILTTPSNLFQISSQPGTIPQFLTSFKLQDESTTTKNYSSKIP